MRIGILRESKQPPDKRAPLTPGHIASLHRTYPEHEFVVQSSSIRAFSNEEYIAESIKVVEELGDSDLLLGVKEIAISSILPGKTYLFFSHTAKKQLQNQKLLQALANNRCTLIDYEYLSKQQSRLVAFGYWAGIVGSYLALLGFGKLTGRYRLKPPQDCKDLNELRNELKQIAINQSMHIVITGEGRVASGAAEILKAAGIRRVAADEFLQFNAKENIFCHAGPQHYTKHFDGRAFDLNHFIHHPNDYEPNFYSFSHKANIFIACHFWDNRSPHFFTRLDPQNPDFKIRFISDISCDVPGPIPTTIRVSTLNEPFYGVARQGLAELTPFDPDQITVCAVDNLPSALPRDASIDFGNQLINAVLPQLLSASSGEIIENATILKHGKLTKAFMYLEDYLAGD